MPPWLLKMVILLLFNFLCFFRWSYGVVMWEIGTLGDYQFLYIYIYIYILHPALRLICMVVLVSTSLHSLL